MHKLGTYAALAALLATAALLAAPVEARVPAPVGTTLTVRSDCMVGPGSLSVATTRQESGSTLVEAAGHDVHNGRWRGGFLLGPASEDADAPDESTDVRASASGRAFHESFEVEGTAAGSNLTMVSGKRHICGVYLGVQRKSVFFGGPRLTAVARYSEPGEMTLRTFLAGCRNGSQWQYSITVDFGEHGEGWGGGGLVCRNESVRLPKAPVSSAGPERPTSIEVEFRDEAGHLRTISYHSEGPR